MARLKMIYGGFMEDLWNIYGGFMDKFSEFWFLNLEWRQKRLKTNEKHEYQRKTTETPKKTNEQK